MIFWSFINAILSLDLLWIVDFILANSFWFFGFIAAGYFLAPHRGMVMNLIILSALIMVSAEFTGYFDLLIYTGIGLMLLYISRMAILLALDNTPGWSRYIPLAWVLSFFVAIFIYNVFIR